MTQGITYQMRTPPVGLPSGMIVKPASPKPKFETMPGNNSRVGSVQNTKLVPKDLTPWEHEYEGDKC